MKQIKVCRNPKCMNEFVSNRNKHYYCCKVCHNAHWKASNRKQENAYKKTDAGKRQAKQSIKNYKKNHPEKHKAHKKAQYHIKREVCLVVGCNLIGERHHPDYDKPLAVKFLCKRHHNMFHRGLLALI